MATLEAVDHHGRGKASVGHTEQVGAPAAAVAAADTGPSSSLPKLTFSHKILFLFYGTHISDLFLSLHFSLLFLSKSFASSLPGYLWHSLLASCSPVSFPFGPSGVPLTECCCCCCC